MCVLEGGQPLNEDARENLTISGTRLAGDNVLETRTMVDSALERDRGKTSFASEHGGHSFRAAVPCDVNNI